MIKKALLYLLLLIVLLAACDDNEPYVPVPTRAVQTNTKQIPKPPPTRTPQPPPTRTPEQIQPDNDPVSITDEIAGGGKTDTGYVDLTVQNLSGEVICNLYIWPYDAAFNNQDKLGGNRLAPGQSSTLPRFESGDYHMVAVACNGIYISRDTFLTDLVIWKLYYFPK